MDVNFLALIFVGVGLISGLLGGLLGIGGGVITVPILYFILEYGGIFEDRVMQVAVSTSLATSFVTSAVATLAQIKKKAILYSTLRFLIPGLVIGCIAGCLSAHFLSSSLLRLIFAGMAIFLGLYFFFPKLPPLQISSSPNRGLSFFGLIIGWLSSMLGIGGGALTFPVLLGYQIEAKYASATSSFSTLVTTFLGTATYLMIAWHRPELPQTFGYIDLPAFIAISLGAILTTPFGVYLAHVLNVGRLKQIFGACLSFIGLSMFFL